MRISVKLYEAIINGNLNPNSAHNTSNGVFTEILADKVRASKDDSKTFFKELKRASKPYFPYMELEDCDNLKQYNLPPLLEYFGKLTPQNYFDKITEFYSYLISHETERLFISLSNVLYERPEFIDREYQTRSLTTNLELIFKLLGEQNWTSKQSQFVLDTLKIKVYYLYKKILHHYVEYCENTELTDAEILNDLFPTSDSVDWNHNYAYKTIYGFISVSQENVVENPHKAMDLKPVNANNSFTYKDFTTRGSNIGDLLNSLKKHNLIAQDSQLPHFNKIFNNSVITNPIIWTGSISELHYFVKLIHSIKKYVVDTNKQQYAIACKCFIKPDGSFFDRDNLKEQKKPKLRAVVLEKIVDNLK